MHILKRLILISCCLNSVNFSILASNIFLFSSNESLDKWSLRGDLTLNYTNNNKGHLIFNVWTKNQKEQWPAAILKGDNLSIKNWSNYNYLEFNVETLSVGKVAVYVRDRNGKVASKYFNIFPGNISIRLNFQDYKNVNWSRINEFQIYATRPHKELNFKISDIILYKNDIAKTTSNKVKLASFENQRQVDRWSKRTGVKMISSRWPENYPGSCAKVIFEKFTGKNQAWPAIVLDKAQFVSDDWKNVESVEVEVNSPTGGEIMFCLISAKEKILHKFNLTKGRQILNLSKLSFPQNTENMLEFQALAIRPCHDIVLYIGNIYLNTLDNKAVKKKLIDTLNAIKNDKYTELSLQITNLIAKINNSQTPKNFEKSVKDIQIQYDLTRLKNLRANNPLLAVWANSTEKIYRDNHIFNQFPTSNPIIDVAKNEAEAIQLLLFPAKTMEVTAQIIKTPKDKNNNIIPLNAIEIRPVGYIFCTKSPYFVEREGYHPDPLLEQNITFSIDKDLIQPYFLEVKIPKNQKAGLYKGEVQVTFDKQIMNVPFEVLIRNFDLNTNLAYPSIGALRQTDLPSHPKTDVERKKWKIQAFKLLQSHYLTPGGLYNNSPTSLEDAKMIINDGAKVFNIRHLENGTPLNECRKAIEEYKKHNILDKAIFYGFDEAPYTRFDDIRRVYTQFKKAFPEVKFSTTAYDLSYGKNTNLDVIDIWIPLIDEYENNSQSIKEARDRGKEIWWYIACLPRQPYPNIHIERKALETRLLMGLMSWKYKPQGFLYYSGVYWYKWAKGENGEFKKSPIDFYLTGAPLTNWPSASWKDFNGDGNLIYPSKNEILGSLRLKALRDGMEDYIALAMLQEIVDSKNNMSKKWNQKAINELKISNELVHSLTKYTRNVKLVSDKRKMINDLLEEYYLINMKDRK